MTVCFVTVLHALAVETSLLRWMDWNLLCTEINPFPYKLLSPGILY